MVFSATGGITTTKDRGAGDMIVSGHATGEDELSCLTIPQGAVLDSALSNTSGLVCLEHLTGEEL